VNPRCTCGALLPEDARFCHKCGKPQYEQDIARLSAQETASASGYAAVPPPLPAGLAISFRNSRAVWISVLVAALALFAVGIAARLSPYLTFLVLPAAGMIAVKLYRGQSAEALSPAAGARLGWMTGLWLFLIVLVLVAAFSVIVASPEGRQMLKDAPGSADALKLLTNPHDFAVTLPLMLFQMFLFVTVLSGLGGMLGARLFRGPHS
jgi:hypothetical protein